ncbi:MAG: hypothetical protein ACOCYB_12850 [Alkalispirochaeta sp.]
MKRTRSFRPSGHLVIVAVLLGLGLTGLVYSQDAEIEQVSSVGFDFAYYPGDQEGSGVTDGGFAPLSYQTVEPDGGAADDERVLGTTWGNVELKGYYQHAWIMPALRWGDGALSANNNLTLRSTTGVSPISVTQEVRAVLTPIAFLQFTAGGLVGTGWNLQIFDGLGEVDLSDGSVDDGSFEGAVLRGFLGGTFQFDFAAIFPGEWNHVVTVFSPQWTYSALTGAEADVAWSFEADDGTNYRGWEYKTTAVLGYQPPWEAVSIVGVLYEGERLIGNAVDRARAAAPEDFDPGFRTDRLALLANFALGEERRHSLTVLPQFQRNRLPSEETIYNEGVQRRETVGSYWDFYRVAVQYRFALQ